MRSLSSTLLALVLAAPAAAQGRPLAIEDYYKVRTAGAPQLSPDGKWVAFTLSVRTEATNADSTTVWLVPTDASAPERRVSPLGGNAANPTWRPDGRLQFTARGFTLDLDPANPDSVSGLVRPDSRPATEGVGTGPAPARGERVLPSPDGKLTALLRNTPPPPHERAFASDFERRHEQRFRGRSFDWLEFQRDGQDYPVANASDPEVSPPQEIFLNQGGANERQLTRLGLRPQGLEWSADGTQLVFSADSGYRDERRYEHGQVWTVALDGTVRRVSPDPDYDYGSASFSPDGKWILYTRQISTDLVIARHLDNGGPTDLAIVPAGGGPERVLTADWDYLPQGARWSPDGQWIYFTGGLGGTNHLFKVSPAGGAVVQVTTGERRLNSLSFDKAMTRMAFSVGRLEAPSEISVADLDGGHERQLTHLQQEFTREIALDTPERLQFKSKDGTPIEGWLYRPYGYRAGSGGPYPLIVFSHGGPHSAYGYGFDFKLQYFAANGYFVLTTNFRSSTGYGEKFLWATWGGWGNKDGEDVMAGVDYVIARHPIDARRVATVGHSYGGFMSNWLITQYPDRFAAAAVGAGIVNWVSDYGTADIARTKETEFYGTPWDPKARELMMKQSPLSYANRVKAATLFINGEIDQRVPYSEAEQMFVALKKNGVPAKVIQYAGQPHGIAGSWNNVHRMLNELRWLDAWLKPLPKKSAANNPQ